MNLFIWEDNIQFFLLSVDQKCLAQHVHLSAGYSVPDRFLVRLLLFTTVVLMNDSLTLQCVLSKNIFFVI